MIYLSAIKCLFVHSQEQWIFAQFERTLSSDIPDNHPDAHACRLKLNLAVLYSDNKSPWVCLIHECLAYRFSG